jgi:hypothetical protein
MKLWTIAMLALCVANQKTDLSGTWKQDNNRCIPKRSGDVTIDIRYRDPELVVETNSKGLITRHAIQRYTTDGVESKSVGTDGDEFHSIAVWKDERLEFNIIEIEEGRRLKSTETWSLIEGGRSLRRLRHTEKSGDQTLIYIRTK